MRHGDIDNQLSAALDKSEIERAARLAEENEKLVHDMAELNDRLKRSESDWQWHGRSSGLAR